MEDAAGEISFLITLELREEDGKNNPDRKTRIGIGFRQKERQYPVKDRSDTSRDSEEFL